MKYRFTYLPNTQKARTFKVRSIDGKNETVFSITREMLGIWGNPEESKLEQFMIAYVQKNGWPKQTVTIGAADTARRLNHCIADLNKAKGKK